MYKKLLFVFIFSILAYARVNIVPLGDSITFGDSYNPPPDSLKHSYRNYLWYKMKDYDVNYVGSKKTGWDVVPHFDPDNEGYPGWTSFDIANITYNIMVTQKPDIVLLHIGSNDMWISGNADNPSMNGVDAILNDIDDYERDTHRHVKVILARIIDRTYHPAFTNIFNQKLQELANRRRAQGDDIVVVDMQHWAGLNGGDYQDPTHPNSNGYKKMAKVWFDALRPYISKKKKKKKSKQINMIPIYNMLLLN